VRACYQILIEDVCRRRKSLAGQYKFQIRAIILECGQPFMGWSSGEQIEGQMTAGWLILSAKVHLNVPVASSQLQTARIKNRVMPLFILVSVRKRYKKNKIYEPGVCKRRVIFTPSAFSISLYAYFIADY